MCAALLQKNINDILQLGFYVAIICVLLLCSLNWQIWLKLSKSVTDYTPEIRKRPRGRSGRTSPSISLDISLGPFDENLVP